MPTGILRRKPKTQTAGTIIPLITGTILLMSLKNASHIRQESKLDGFKVGENEAEKMLSTRFTRL